MSRSLEKDPTRFFSVVGAAYVPERHADSFDHSANHHRDAAPPRTRPAEIGLAASWVVLASLITGILIFAGEVSVLANVGLSRDFTATVIE